MRPKGASENIQAERVGTLNLTSRTWCITIATISLTEAGEGKTLKLPFSIDDHDNTALRIVVIVCKASLC